MQGISLRTRLFRQIKYFARIESGAIMILAAIALPALLVAAGLAFEVSNYTVAKSRFNNALDQALLATAAARPDNPTAFAREYMTTNLLSGEGEYITLDAFTITSTSDGIRWIGEAQGTVKPHLARLIGRDGLTLRHSAKVEWSDSTTSEIVAMVDVSGTMCANFQRTREVDGAVAIDFIPDRNCTKLDMMKEALTQILTIGVGYTEGGNGLAVEPSYKVGIVPFSFKVRLPNPAAVPSFLLQGEIDAGYGSTYFTDLRDAEANGAGPLPSVVPLMPIRNDVDKANLLAAVNNITTNDAVSFNRPAWKRSSLGAQISALMLDPRYKDMFGTAGATPAAFGAPRTEKIVIMMTDSANLGCCFTNWPLGNFRGNYIYSHTPDHLALVGDGARPGICKQMKDAGIEIYTVLLDVDPNDMNQDGKQILAAFKDCATSSEHAFEIPYGDTETLKAAYKVIGKSLIKLRLTE